MSLAFDDNVVLRDISFSMRTGHMTVLLGPSGAGKSVVLKLILGLLKPDSGEIRIHGERIDTLREEEMIKVRGDMGMLFQESALFDSLTVADNVGYRLYEETDMPDDQVHQRVQEVLGFIGMSEYLNRMPSELSGGQRRRVAIARAMAARPHLLLFDDPTSGLDPMTAKTVDDEIVKLRDVENVTSIVVTHQLPDAFYIASHEAVQRDGRLTVVPSDRDQAEDTSSSCCAKGGSSSRARLLNSARQPIPTSKPTWPDGCHRSPTISETPPQTAMFRADVHAVGTALSSDFREKVRTRELDPLAARE